MWPVMLAVPSGLGSQPERIGACEVPPPPASFLFPDDAAQPTNEQRANQPFDVFR